MTRRLLEAWNKFIRGRIAQEQGREEAALGEFEQAIDPNNRCFRDASKVAHDSSSRHLRSVEEHLLVRVQQGYERLAETIPSRPDEPIEGFKRVLAQLEGRTPFEISLDRRIAFLWLPFLLVYPPAIFEFFFKDGPRKGGRPFILLSEIVP
jgi:hypothetical protein